MMENLNTLNFEFNASIKFHVQFQYQVTFQIQKNVSQKAWA